MNVLEKMPTKFFEDDRGWFQEVCRESETGIYFRQTSISCSRFGVVRGLHYQSIPHAIGRIVTCIYGELFDVAVNLATGKHRVFPLKSNEQVFIPWNYAHGFQVISESALIVYSTTDEFCSPDFFPECEKGILWNDINLNIDWPYPDKAILSEKDKRWPKWKQ